MSLEGQKRMTNSADHLTRIERNLRFILRHLQTLEGNFEPVDELSCAAHSSLRALEEVKRGAQLTSCCEAEFEVSIRRENATPLLPASSRETGKARQSAS